MNYRPDIDGLRALAVLPVVFYHAGLPGPSGGFVGVDVFFVISGFLITKIIANEMERDRFTLIGFYERRARRILPALTVVVLATLAVGWFVLLPDELRDLGQSAVAAAVFLSNVYFFQHLNYFDSGDFAPLLHTWSLAVEEQFYLAFPPFLALLIWRRGKGTAVTTLAAVSILSLAAAVALLPTRPSWVFYLIFSRAWELGAGALLALVALPALRSRVAREAIGWAGLILILIPVFAYSSATPFPGVSALPPVAGAVALIYVGSHDGGARVSKLLSRRWLVWIGLISYSLYLWHWPVMVYLRILGGSAVLPFWLGIGAVALSVLFAWASYRFVETPFRRRPPRGLGRRPLLAVSGASLVAMVVLGGLLHVTEGVPKRVPQSVLAVAGAKNDLTPGALACFQRVPAEGLCAIGRPTDDTEPKDFLIWGDSHAVVMLAGLNLAAKAAGRQGFVAGRTACPPVWNVVERPALHTCSVLNRSVRAFLKERTDMPLVILVARWPLWVEGTGFRGEWGGEVVLEWNGEGAVRPAVQDNAALVEAGLAATIAEIRATGREVALVGPVPEIGWNVPSELARRGMLGWPDPAEVTGADFEIRAGRAMRILSRMAATDAGVRYISLKDVFCGDGHCAVRDKDGVPLYVDDDHITRSAAETLLPEPLSGIWIADEDGT